MLSVKTGLFFCSICTVRMYRYFFMRCNINNMPYSERKVNKLLKNAQTFCTARSSSLNKFLFSTYLHTLKKLKMRHLVFSCLIAKCKRFSQSVSRATRTRRRRTTTYKLLDCDSCSKKHNSLSQCGITHTQVVSKLSPYVCSINSKCREFIV